MKKYFKAQRSLLAILGFVLCLAFLLPVSDKPVLYIIGDSTVRNGDGTGKNQQWGWGSFIGEHVDTAKLGAENHAIGGRSSRTFITEGRWDRILATLKKGDFVLMQFGHNDGGPLDDTARARGTIKGIGNDSVLIYNPVLKKQETVHSYGWYIRKYIRDAIGKGAIPIVCSPIPRNDWKEGRVLRASDSYPLWAKQVAMEEKAFFIDLHGLVITAYEKLGEEKVRPFFPVDHTHTNREGALLNTQIVIAALRELKAGKLNTYLLPG